jgi:hypothetical protein
MTGLLSCGRAAMTVDQKVARKARESENPYPEGLAARLEWWREALGIDRVRFLRMIGLSARQAERGKDDDLKEIVESPDWADNALGLEGVLVHLVSFFHDDPRVLAEWIRASAAGRPEETCDATGAKGPTPTNRPHARQNGKASDVWADRIHEGGPQAFTSLISYLIESEAEAEADCAGS